MKKRRNSIRGGGETKFSKMRIDRKIKQEDLAILADVAIGSIRRYEREGIGSASVDAAARIANVLMCRIEDLID